MQTSTAELSDCLNEAQALEGYRRMLRIRRFEEEGIRQFKAGKISGAFHASLGQEAAIVGTCLALEENDTICGTHRSHGHPIGKGADLKSLMAELMGKSTGISKGRGGSMHLADRSVGIIGQSAIVGGGIPLATGAALSAKVRRTSQVSVCFFGDGAVNQGTFHESLNMASLWTLPVVYVCENNGYAITTSVTASHAQPSIAKRAAAYAMPGVALDGQNLVAVYVAARDAVSRARSNQGPTLIEAITYRFDEHSVGLAVAGPPYRSAEEVTHNISHRDPVTLFRQTLLSEGVAAVRLTEIENEVTQSVAEAVGFALESPLPKTSDLYEHLWSNA